MKYIIKKLLTLILNLFFISVLVFLIFQVIPGDPALSILGTEVTEEQVEEMFDVAELSLICTEYIEFVIEAIKDPN